MMKPLPRERGFLLTFVHPYMKIRLVDRRGGPRHHRNGDVLEDAPRRDARWFPSRRPGLISHRGFRRPQRDAKPATRCRGGWPRPLLPVVLEMPFCTEKTVRPAAPRRGPEGIEAKNVGVCDRPIVAAHSRVPRLSWSTRRSTSAQEVNDYITCRRPG